MNKYSVTFKLYGETQTVTIRQTDIGEAAKVFVRSAKKIGLNYGPGLRASSPDRGTIHGPEGGATIRLTA